jgi:hypothetical protein
MGKFDMTAIGRKLVTAGIALVGVGAIVTAPTIQTPPPPAAPAIRLAAATSPPAVQPLAQTNAIGALLRLDLGRFIIPPSAGQPFPTPQFPGPSPAPTDFAGTIKSTYVAIEPWVHYGFQLAQYAVGWVPYVGWLSPQIDIFYHFGERIVRSIVFNSADWLWGPLPFAVGLGNIAWDSWNSLVQLGIDQWNFWLPPLPPLPPFPFAARQAQPQSAAAETLAPSVQQVAPRTAKLDPPDPVAAQEVGLQESDLPEADPNVTDTALDTQRVQTPANPKDDLEVQADLPLTDATPTNPDETSPDETMTNHPASAAIASGAPSGVTSPPVTLPRRPKPFGKKPKPADETSNPSPAASGDSVGMPKRPTNRFTEPKKHRVTDSPSDGTASPARLAPSR